MSQFLIDTLTYTGLLILAVLLLRRPVARAFGAQVAYALWALPLLRLVLPPIELPAALAPQAPAAPVETVVVMADPAPVVATPQPAFDWSTAALALWLAGAMALLVWRLVSYRRMRAGLLADAVKVGQAGKVRLVETPAVPAPVAFGVIDKVVALPMGFMGWRDRKARDLALAHELAHHARHDLLANMAAQPLLALHWFNPLAWAGWRAMRRDQEAACDARVLAEHGHQTREAYGRLIAGFAGGPRLALAAPMACPVLGEKSVIHRLRSLTMPEPTQTRRRLGLGLICGAALALPLTATIGYAAPETPPAPAAPAAPAKVEKRIVIVERFETGKPGKEGKRRGKPAFTRTIEKDGKTIVVHSDKELSDADIAERVAKIEKEVGTNPDMAFAKDGKSRVMIIHGDGPMPPMPSMPPMPPEAGGPGQHRELRIMRMGPGGPGGKDGHRMVMMMHGGPRGPMECKDGQSTQINADSDKDGKKDVVRMRICSVGAGGPRNALEGLKRARERLASNPELSADVKKQVLDQLDGEIARLSKGS